MPALLHSSITSDTFCSLWKKNSYLFPRISRESPYCYWCAGVGLSHSLSLVNVFLEFLPQLISWDFTMSVYWFLSLLGCSSSNRLSLATFTATGLDGYTQSTTDSFDWSKRSTSTPTVYTGPSYDHTVGYGGCSSTRECKACLQTWIWHENYCQIT